MKAIGFFVFWGIMFVGGGYMYYRSYLKGHYDSGWDAVVNFQFFDDTKIMAYDHVLYGPIIIMLMKTTGYTPRIMVK